jgi:hypothetical protein
VAVITALTQRAEVALAAFNRSTIPARIHPVFTSHSKVDAFDVHSWIRTEVNGALETEGDEDGQEQTLKGQHPTVSEFRSFRDNDSGDKGDTGNGLSHISAGGA